MPSAKRSHDDSSSHDADQLDLGETLTPLENGPADATEEDNGDGWVQVKRRKKNKSKSKAAKPSDEDHSYPAITHSANARLQTSVRINDLQSLVLWLLADGPAPQWVSVRNGRAVQKVVIVMAPGLERGMFDGSVSLMATDENQDISSHTALSAKRILTPDDYYPTKLNANSLPDPLKGLAGIFPHLWPVKSPGDDRMSKMHSPLQAILSIPLPKSQEQKQQNASKSHQKNATPQSNPTQITEYIASLEDLVEHDFVVPPVLLDTDEQRTRNLEKRTALNQTRSNGWLDLGEANTNGNATKQKDEPLRRVYAIDCEMCMTGVDSFDLTRISIVDWDGEIVLDELVKPARPVVNYLTPFSGITKDKLDAVTTTLEDIQTRVKELFDANSILVGHSLNSDLSALKITHPYVVDTTILYPHVRGLPLRNSLKFLTQKHLSREIQTRDEGHDSVEDARAALDLVKLKCEYGPQWGMPDVTSESIFKRLARSSLLKGRDRKPAGAVIDWGVPQRGYGASADVCIGCKNDEEVVKGVTRAVRGDGEDPIIPGDGVDFTWARMRELEAVRGWWNSTKTADNEELLQNARNANTDGGGSANGNATDLANAVSRTVGHIKDMFEALPPCTAFIVYSGNGDPRDLARLQEQLRQYKQEFATKKWDQLSVQWTDREEQALKEACRKARDGIGFITVK